MSRRAVVITMGLVFLGLVPFALAYVIGELQTSACEDGAELSAETVLARPPQGYAVRRLSESRLDGLRDALGRNEDVEVSRTTGATATRGGSTVAVVLFTATDTADAQALLEAYSADEGFDTPLPVGSTTGRMRTRDGLTAVLGVASRCSLALVLSPDEAGARRVAGALATRPAAAARG